jgi:hypothetical protein
LKNQLKLLQFIRLLCILFVTPDSDRADDDEGDLYIQLLHDISSSCSSHKLTQLFMISRKRWDFHDLLNCDRNCYCKLEKKVNQICVVFFFKIALLHFTRLYQSISHFFVIFLSLRSVFWFLFFFHRKFFLSCFCFGERRIENIINSEVKRSRTYWRKEIESAIIKISVTWYYWGGRRMKEKCKFFLPLKKWI